MTKFINLQYSIMSCNAITSGINHKLHLLQVAKVKEGKTYHAAGLSRFTRLKFGDLVDFTRLKCRSARVRQARQCPPAPCPTRAYIRAWELELELEMGAGAGAGAEK